jgi:hypothetical protein
MPIVTIFPGTLSGGARLAESLGARLGLRVVSTMLEHDVDLVPVMDGAKTVGVILMTDVFDNVAEYVLERSAK